MSARTIAGYMTNDFRGLNLEEWYAPSDWDDFSRCYDLLKIIPEWRSRMHEMRKHREWIPWADRWEEISAAYERDEGESVPIETFVGEYRILVDK